jgi:lipopolysaccharide transport system permease protein
MNWQGLGHVHQPQHPLQHSSEVGRRLATFARQMSPIGLAAHIWRHRDLAWQLTAREVTGRYRSSLLGFGWSFITPLVTLSAYTFVFGLVFRARWPQATPLGAGGGLSSFGLTLFAGLIAFTFFAECLTRAPGIIIASPNYVKKVVFPLEVLPVSVVGSALFHAGISAVVLVVMHQVIEGGAGWTAVFLPVVFVPLVLIALGTTWFFASVGVFFRDAVHSVVLMSQVLMFMTPVFYPVTAVPERFRWLLQLNPLTALIENTRRVTVQGLPPDWPSLGISFVIGSVAALVGYAWFASTKRAFADVI